MPSSRQAGEAPPPFTPDSRWLQAFRRRLRDWFGRHHRDLPWRRTGDLYAIWISEIMLQQTQVATVVPYFERFLEAFPDVRSLAAAAPEQVLRQWEGLGYYRRARQLHEAAGRIVRDHGGEFPEQFEQVLALPGIGRYTAGAILSIGRDQPLPIVEANTLRLYSRLLSLRTDPRKAEGQRRLWEFAQRLLPRRGAGSFNQALMELGSEVCTPRQPRCEQCPVEPLCNARRHGLQEQLPVAAPKTRYEEVTEAAVVLWRDERVLLRQCRADERWSGMWDFLRFPLEAPGEPPTPACLRDGARRLSGAALADVRPLTRLKYGVTRYRITLHVYQARLRQGADVRPELGPLQWAAAADLDRTPLSVTGRRISRLLEFPATGASS